MWYNFLSSYPICHLGSRAYRGLALATHITIELGLSSNLYLPRIPPVPVCQPNDPPAGLRRALPPRSPAPAMPSAEADVV